MLKCSIIISRCCSALSLFYFKLPLFISRFQLWILVDKCLQEGLRYSLEYSNRELTCRSMMEPNRTRLKPGPSEKDSWYQCFCLLLRLLLVFSLDGFPQSSARCACASLRWLIAHHSHRDRVSDQPCWTNCLQRCPCRSWNDENYGSCTSEEDVHWFLSTFLLFFLLLMYCRVTRHAAEEW